MSVVEELAPENDPAVTSPPRERARRWAKLLTTFLTGQMLVQGLGLVTGFLLLRWMTVEAYAQYSVAFAFQSTVNLLVDVGFNGCIIALVGVRGGDPAVIGGYTRVARTYRGRMFYVVGGLSAVAFPLVVAHQPWGWPTKAMLLGAVLAGVFFNAWDVYRAPLLIHQRLADSYRADAIPAAGRLVLSGFLHSVGGLFGWAAAWFSALMNLGSGLLLRKASAELVHEPDCHDPALAKEALKYLAPLWPGMVFYAFQGQITVALISIFGKTHSIADVAALGRLGQVFSVLTALNSVLLVPRIARQEGKPLVKTIGVGIGGITLTLALTALLGFVFPSPFVVLLGKNYVGLSRLVGFVLLNSTLGYLGGSLYSVLAVKKWVTQSVTWSQIAAIVTVQVLYVLCVGVRTPSQAVAFSLVTSCAGVTVIVVRLLDILRKDLRGRVAPSI